MLDLIAFIWTLPYGNLALEGQGDICRKLGCMGEMTINGVGYCFTGQSGKPNHE